ncbi:MAG: type II toxin-antitoxin system MqsA family antitoxin [Thermodesulfobacteriota bacterium]|nr:type II toxin-antitoxin system MqsA family antitoxin [Thermodesulfobacteriota bacterium]
MYSHGDQCPICGIGVLTEESKTEVFEYKGQRKTVADFRILLCPVCDEEIVPESSIKKSEKILRDFHREVDGLLTAKQIKKIREAYGFTQENFSEILGVGKKTFARYENCTVTQNRTTDHLLRVIDVLPEALDIICEQPTITPYYRYKKSSETITVPKNQPLQYIYKMGSGNG